MKKTGFGCGFILLLFLLVSGGLVFWVFRPVITVVSEVREIQKIHDQIENREPYEREFEDGLTPDQVERFIAVHRRMQGRMEERIEGLRLKYEQADFKPQDGQVEGLGQLRGLIYAYAELVGLLTEAKRAQVEALNAEGLSIHEYVFIRNQFLRTLGYGAYVEIGEFPDSIHDGQVETGLPELPESTLRRNLELIEPYQEELEPSMILSVFGL